MKRYVLHTIIPWIANSRQNWLFKDYTGPDYGLKADEEAILGVPCKCIIAADDHKPFYVVPVSSLEEVTAN